MSTAAFALLCLTASAWAQVSIKPSDDDAKPLVAPGTEVSSMAATDKSSNRVLLHLDAAAKTATFTEFTQNAKGELEYLKVTSVKPTALRPMGEFGSRVETEENDYFGGKVHVVVLSCEGANEACVNEQGFNSVNGEPGKKDTQTYFKAHFRALADAQRVLDQVMKLR